MYASKVRALLSCVVFFKHIAIDSHKKIPFIYFLIESFFERAACHSQSVRLTQYVNMPFHVKQNICIFIICMLLLCSESVDKMYLYRIFMSTDTSKSWCDVCWQHIIANGTILNYLWYTKFNAHERSVPPKMVTHQKRRFNKQ